MVYLAKVKVTREQATALDKFDKDEWSKQFNLIAHCKNFSSNGIRMGDTYLKEFDSINSMQPLEFAKCLILGYEIKED